MKIKYGKILIWFILNTILGLVITMLLLTTTGRSWQKFVEVMLITHFISTSSALSGYGLNFLLQKYSSKNRFWNQNEIVRLILSILTSVAVALTSGYIGILIIPGIFDDPAIFTLAYKDGDIIIFFGIVMGVTLLIAFSATSFELLQEKFKGLQQINVKQNNKNQQKINIGLSIREQGNLYLIEHDQINYISSHGRYSVVHTTQRQYKAVLLLKDIEARLPDSDFYRIHKSYIVRLKAISHIKYYSGGSYIIFLKDEEETSLPVSRKHAPYLKQLLS